MAVSLLQFVSDLHLAASVAGVAGAIEPALITDP
jgi:hypothetical protein